MKPILGLIVLLTWPCLGLGGRAVAGFALGRTTPAASPSKPVRFQLTLVLNEDEGDPPAEQGSGGVEDEGKTPQPMNAPSRYFPFRVIFPALSGLHGDGGPSTGSTSSTSAGGAGLPLIFTLVSLVSRDEGSRRLYLWDERIKPPAFASRWFRPPR